MIQRRSRAGFTLTELAIVTVVIAVLIAVAFSVFQKVANKSETDARCRSNMGLLAIAFLQYSQDFDETFPAGINATGNGWAGQTYSFVKSTQFYQCSKDPHNGSYISYAENRNIVGQNLKKFTDPASTVALYEATTLNCDPSTPETVSATSLSAPQDSTRHDSRTFGLNFLLTDGHVKMLTPGQVSGGPTAVPPKNAGLYAATFAVR